MQVTLFLLVKKETTKQNKKKRKQQREHKKNVSSVLGHGNKSGYYIQRYTISLYIHQYLYINFPICKKKSHLYDF